MESEVLTIGQVSEQYGVPVRRIRYFCNRGFILGVKRDSRRHRTFTTAQCELLYALFRLGECGLSTPELKAYAKSSALQRKAMIVTLLHQLREKVKILNEDIDFLTQKEEFFEEILRENSKSAMLS